MSEVEQTPTSQYQSVKDYEHGKVYTNLFFQRPLTFKQASLWVFFHYLTIGLIQGYYVSV